MIPALKSEFRKLLTVRSTYFIVGISLLIVAFFAGLIDGFNNNQMALQKNPMLLANDSASAVTFVGLILAFAGLLLMGHEYRYNTIMYSLTATNRRTKVLVAKVITVSVFAIVTSLFVTFFSPLCTIVGAALHGHHIGPQTYDLWSVVWRCVFCGWGYAMFAFLLVAIMRNQIGAIVTFLLIPLVGENILFLLVKEAHSKFLPFFALRGVTDPSTVHGASSGYLAGVVLIYVAIGLLVGFVLFSRRDAN